MEALEDDRTIIVRITTRFEVAILGLGAIASIG